MGTQTTRNVLLGAMTTLVAYVGVLRPRQLRWGASAAEYDRTLPGDDLVRHPHFRATRGITIRARPEQIWPWLLQLGSGRAGWYSLDWIDTAGHLSATVIVPRYQQIATNDCIPFTPDGTHGMWVPYVLI